MTNRYDIYCINCGKELKRVRISQDKEDSISVDCPECNLSSTIPANGDDEMRQSEVEIFADKNTTWKNTDLNLAPIFTCPFCGHFKMKTLKEDTPNNLKCSNKECGRIIEVMFT